MLAAGAERRYAGVTHVDVSELDVASIQAIVAETGVRISALGYRTCSPPDPDEAATCLQLPSKVMAAAPSWVWTP